MRESKIERYLKREVVKAGGVTKKMKNTNDPDQLVIWPDTNCLARFGVTIMFDNAKIHFVECKAPGKKARPGQVREHVRLQMLGCKVLVIDTLEKVDDYVKGNK